MCALGHLAWLYSASADSTICARVSIRIEQEAVITRTAFEATLAITNDETSPDSLESILVQLEIRDAAGASAASKFGIPTPDVDGIADVEGGGSLGPGQTGSARWLILPTDAAAPSQEPVAYFVGGELSYIQGGNLVTVPLYPVRIVVYPDARLFLKYFLQSPVYSDNPFTPDVIEPAEPFSLGLMVENAGLGAARNFRITSAQPQITRNDSQLLIAFEMLAAQVGLAEIAPSLTANLGDIEPESTAVAGWLMRTTLQGEFICYNASFEHVNELDDPRLSLIQNVEIMELNHVVLLNGDDLPDFLVNAQPPMDCDDDGDPIGASSGCTTGEGDDVPDCIHSSERIVLPITNQVLDLMADGPITEQDLTAVLTVQVADPGWSYIRAEDPGRNEFRLVSATRSDGVEILVGPTGGSGDMSNSWTTHRFVPPESSNPTRQDRLHLLDEHETPGTYSYTLVYEPILLVTTILVNEGLFQRSNVKTLSVAFSGDTNVAGLIQSGLITDAVEVWQRGAPELGSVDAKLPLTAGHYAWDDTSRVLTIDLTVDGPGGSSETMLSDANYELRIMTESIQSGVPGAMASLVDGDGFPDGIYRFGDHAIEKFFRFSGDGNGDRTVNEVDEALVINSWLKSAGDEGYNPNADMNSDGIVNFLDLQIVRANWMNSLGF